MNYSGKIIVLAYPDTFVKMSDEWQCRLFPFVGLGTRNSVKAGHAAIVLIENKTGNASYYDFGRYVTPNGFGRVRSAITDVELTIPFKAKLIGNGPIENLNEFLLWLEANPQKTHGKGRLVASICNNVFFEKANDYIQSLQCNGSMPYKAFKKKGSNCARFVTETLLASVDDKKIIKKLNHIKRFTPSTVGNVEIAGSSGVYEVIDGSVNKYNGSALKENLKNYFHKENKNKSFKKDIGELPVNAQYLSGIGSSAWFAISTKSNTENLYQIKRYNDGKILNHIGWYRTNEEFDIHKEYRFTYDSNCQSCQIIQNHKKIKFYKVKTCPEFIQLQEVFSA